MSWSFTVPEVSREDFENTVNEALVRANVSVQNKDGVESAELAAELLKALINDWPPGQSAKSLRAFASGHNNSAESGRVDDTFHLSIERVK